MGRGSDKVMSKWWKGEKGKNSDSDQVVNSERV